MSTFDEITKEKRRLSEALARIDARREKLSGQLSELEATEGVLARYSRDSRARKTATAQTPIAATSAAAPARSGRRQRTTTAKPAGGKRALPSLSDQALALATGKTQQAETSMSVSEVQPSTIRGEATIQTGRVVLNLDTHVVSVDNRPVDLTAKEYSILELLSLRKGTTLTKEMCLDRLYGGVDEPKLKIIDVFICKLRKKLAQVTGGDHHIETVWGRGYVLQDPVAMPGNAPSRSPEPLSSDTSPTGPSL